jgi:3-hydroxyacyl-CoA dehydrogenase
MIPPWIDQAHRYGRLGGRKNGKGFYRYDGKRVSIRAYMQTSARSRGGSKPSRRLAERVVLAMVK